MNEAIVRLLLQRGVLAKGDRWATRCPLGSPTCDQLAELGWSMHGHPQKDERFDRIVERPPVWREDPTITLIPAVCCVCGIEWVTGYEGRSPYYVSVSTVHLSDPTVVLVCSFACAVKIGSFEQLPPSFDQIDDRPSVEWRASRGWGFERIFAPCQPPKLKEQT